MSDPGEREPADLLLVENDQSDVQLFKEVFEDAQFVNPLHVVPDGDEALDFLCDRGEYTDTPRPDLILLNWHLPNTSGEEVLTELQDDSDFRSIPVIVLTSSQDQADAARSYELQANAYVTKPIDADEFFDKILSLKEFWLHVVRLPSKNECD